MKMMRTLGLSAVVAMSGFMSQAHGQAVTTIEEYNKTLPYWGISWSPGSKSINGYYPSFYTGFAMRSQFPERIHVRTSRGNQTRVSVILDDQTITDYMFDLAKRYSFYKRMTSGSGAVLDIKPSGSSTLPQLTYFNQILESPAYGILATVAQANQGALNEREIYAKGLSVLTALNPHRIFNLRIDLKNEFNKWKAQMQQTAGSDSAKVLNNPASTIAAINSLVLGRINYVSKPTADVTAKLATAVNLAVTNAPEDQFIPAAYELFRAVTGSKYAFRIANPQTGELVNALQCSPAQCTLSYPEFTTIYPTGSVKDFTSDEFGNRITAFATPGLWQFLARGEKGVDNIRNEPYYGFAPKMDFEAIGNGFHNPAVRFWDPSKNLKSALGITPNHNTLWAVKRGGVSHGCLRIPLGHLWEMRQIFPVETEKMIQLNFFGNLAQDFDVYDINGDGVPEVMGVEYLISYGLQGSDGLASREGTDFQINTDRKAEFYQTLYGSKNIFDVVDNTKFVFKNPRISLPSYLDFKQKKVSVRLTMPGNYNLYEQTYEREKVQLYALGAMTDETKKIVRLMGRVKGCAPTSNKQQCGEAAFDQQAQGVR